MKWIKHLLGIDPLVGMYFVTYICHGADPSMGRVVGRVETGNKPKYLLRYFLSEEYRGHVPGDNILITELWLENGSDWCTFHETRKEAQKWQAYRSKCAERERSLHPRHQWKAPEPIGPN